MVILFGACYSICGRRWEQVDADGVAQEILGSVINDKKITSAFALYITADVYSKLDWQDRDNYHSSVDIAGIKAHKRYSDGGLSRCLRAYEIW